jgi:hypothetical protein
MAFVKNSGRQEPSLAYSVVTFGTGKDVDAAGVYPLIELPQRAVVTRCQVNVTGVTSAGVTVSVGDASLATRYASAVSAAAVAMTTSHGTGFKTPTVQDVLLTVAGTPVVSGTVEVYIEYVIDGRAEWSQG